MFLRLVADSFGRRPRHKLLTGAALALGMGVATAALSVALDVGDRLAKEFRSLGANLLVTPQADSLPLEIGGVDYRPVNAGAYLPEADLPKLKTIFWHNNIVGFAPVLEVPVIVEADSMHMLLRADTKPDVVLIGTWASHSVRSPDGSMFVTGITGTNPWWRVDGNWFDEGAQECVVGKNLAAKKGIHLGFDLLVGEIRVVDPPRRARLAPMKSLLNQATSGTSQTKGSSSSNVFGAIVGLMTERIPNEAEVREVVIEHKLQVKGIVSTGGPEDDAIVAPLAIAQQIAQKPSEYRKLYVSALTKPEDTFAKRDPKTFTPTEYDRWFCTPYISSIAFQIQQQLPGTDVRVIRRVAEGEGQILTRVQMLLWLVTAAALLAAALAVGASSAASVIERRTEIGLMKALGAGSATVGFLLAAEQLLLAFVGGGTGYALGIVLARLVGQKIFGVAPEPTLLVLLAVLVLAILVTLLGSAIPLRRAARYEPAPILRGE